MCNQTYPNTDLSAKTPGWRSYEEQFPSLLPPNYQTVFVLTCTSQTEQSSTIWTTLHPNRDAALAYAEKEQVAHQSMGVPNTFSVDIHEAVLDVRKARFCDPDLSTSESHRPESAPVKD